MKFKELKAWKWIVVAIAVVVALYLAVIVFFFVITAVFLDEDAVVIKPAGSYEISDRDPLVVRVGENGEMSLFIQAQKSGKMELEELPTSRETILENLKDAATNDFNIRVWIWCYSAEICDTIQYFKADVQKEGFVNVIMMSPAKPE